MLTDRYLGWSEVIISPIYATLSLLPGCTIADRPPSTHTHWGLSVENMSSCQCMEQIALQNCCELCTDVVGFVRTEKEHNGLFFLAEGKRLLAADSLFRENTDTQTWNPRQCFRYTFNSRCLLPWTSASWTIRRVRSWKAVLFYP